MNHRRALLAIACLVPLIAAPWLLAAEPATVRISSVEVILSPIGPVVLLKAKGRAVPIFVDPVVAESIEAELGGKKPPRPLTHDLMRTILESLDAKITKASITLKGATFIADLRVKVNGKERVFDSRSSDAIALALRFGAPIFVGEDLLQSAGKPLPDSEGQAL
jgi:uncharacterized protein